ncbi:hypothetical protein [Pseudomonas alloputida]|uniref:hypothetical protein n=1 Tax=Pseudomonas TaxID=286 RepID=UPI003EEF4C3B
MIDDDELKGKLPDEIAGEGEPLVPEIEEPEVPAEPEIEEPQAPIGPVDPHGPLARLFEEGKGGRDLDDEEFAAFEAVKMKVQGTFITVLPEHGLDGYENSHFYVYDANSDKSSLRTYLIWALIAGKLEKPDLVQFEIDGTPFDDDEGNLSAAVEETFKRMLKMDPIV